jgi:hypothetical protein
MAVQLPLSPGRSGFTPPLRLSYDLKHAGPRDMREDLRLSPLQDYEVFVHQDEVAALTYTLLLAIPEASPQSPATNEKEEKEEKELHVYFQALSVYNNSPGGLRSFGSLDLQLSLPAKDWSPFPLLSIKSSETSFIHEPALGFTESIHLKDPSDASKVTGDTQVGAQFDIVDIDFKKQLDSKNMRDIVEFKLTLSYQHDLYAGSDQGQLQGVIEGHVTSETVSAVVQGQWPFDTHKFLPPSYGVGLVFHF